ncbi:MAG: lactonase family protein [Porphyromonas sp.]|nr:lactonase family protein [Porphyromonas sp.]
MIKTHKYLYAAASVVLSVMVSSCGLLPFGGGQKSDHYNPEMDQLLLVGTYTDSKSEGVYSFTYNPHSHHLQHKGTFITPNPTYMALDRRKAALYMVNETDKNAMVTSAAIDGQTGRLSALNSSYTLGDGSAYIATVGHDQVVTANYGGGSITLFDADKKGMLGQPDWHILLGDKGVSRPHATVVSPDGKDLLVTDLGQDKVYHFYVNRSNPPLTIDLDNLSLPKGTGPRHLVFDEKGKYVYLIAEKKPVVYVYKHKGGALEEVQKVELSLPAGTFGQHIALSPDGHFLYTSHTDGRNVITVFRVDAQTGRLNRVGEQKVGAKPRHFTFNPGATMLAVACRDADKVEFYDRDRTTGLLKPLTDLSIKVSRPAFVLWTTQL